MNKILRFCIFSIALFSAPLTQSYAENKDHKRLVFFSNEQSIADIISEKVLEVAYARLGYSIEFKYAPAERILRIANTNDLDGITHRVANIDVLFGTMNMVPTPINNFHLVGYSRKDLNLPTELSNKTIARMNVSIVRGVSIIEVFTRGLNVTKLNSTDLIFRHLLMGRTDVLICSDLSSYSFLQKYPNAKMLLNRHPIQMDTIMLYHYLSKVHAALFNDISKELKIMHEKGEINNIRESMLFNHKL